MSVSKVLLTFIITLVGNSISAIIPFSSFGDTLYAHTIINGYIYGETSTKIARRKLFDDGLSYNPLLMPQNLWYSYFMYTIENTNKFIHGTTTGVITIFNHDPVTEVLT